jgi:hypothetical protein
MAEDARYPTCPSPGERTRIAAPDMEIVCSLNTLGEKRICIWRIPLFSLPMPTDDWLTLSAHPQKGLLFWPSALMAPFFDFKDFEISVLRPAGNIEGNW